MSVQTAWMMPTRPVDVDPSLSPCRMPCPLPYPALLCPLQCKSQLGIIATFATPQVGIRKLGVAAAHGGGLRVIDADETTATSAESLSVDEFPPLV